MRRLDELNEMLMALSDRGEELEEEQSMLMSRIREIGKELDVIDKKVMEAFHEAKNLLALTIEDEMKTYV